MECRVNMAEVEKTIEWLRTTTPQNIVELAVPVIEETDPDVIWAACALASARYVNQQAHNLMGFVSHAMIGCEDARNLAKTQKPHTQKLLMIQSLFQTVFDMHDPSLSPYLLLNCGPLREKTIEENIHWLREDIRTGEYLRCDHRLMALKEDLTQAQLIDLVLDIGLEGMTTDDHTFITPALVLGMMNEVVGWEEGFDMLRCAVRYSASFPRNFTIYDRAIGLRKQYQLVDGAPNTTYDPNRVAALRNEFYNAKPEDRPEIAARAMAKDNIAPVTILAAASLCATDFYLKVTPVPHEDFDAVSREVAPIHIGNCISTMRTIFPMMSPATQALAAIQAGSLLERGPSVLNKDFEFIPFQPEVNYPYPEDVEKLRDNSPESLLDLMSEAIKSHEYRITTAAIQTYAETGAAPESLIATLTEIACTDDGTLMHNFKNLNSMVKEFWQCNLPDRWNYLMEAARFMAWYANLQTDVYQRAVKALDTVNIAL